MQPSTNPGRVEPSQPDAIRVAHDVNQAIYDALTPQPVEPARYDLTLVPRRDWTASEADWDQQLTAIFRAVRQRYPVLLGRPTQQDVRATLTLPMSTTHQLIVGRIFSPSFRPTGRSDIRRDGHAALEDRRWRLDGHGKDAALLNRQQVDFEVHRAIVETLVPQRIAEDDYNVRLKPSNCTDCPAAWARELVRIRAALRRKYGRLTAEDNPAEATATYDQPLCNTKDCIVEEILGAAIWFPRG